MARYWPIFFLVFMDRDRVKVHELAKKERGQYPAIYLTSLISEGFTIWFIIAPLRANQIARITSDFKMDLIKSEISHAGHSSPKQAR